MSSDSKIYLNKAEQAFLMEMFEVEDPVEGIEEFAKLMTIERADTSELQKYLKAVIKKWKEKA